ncbi:hypothetical protein B0A50_01821 [Salinomyces thailandicus]|uniref:Signal peptidase complex subunit 2 n=1 Tax=Salinomyces thailandicus TaxID=706561 RepID=A0A4U0U8U8_9PEZI|nr:hypothetical protein B0A50_01821 [Salinomyces thailandica]
MSTPRISPHSLPDLKSTTDDALTNYLLSLNFTPIHTKLDTRLALGYTSVIIAAITFAADYKLGWEATKTWTAVAVVAYGALNAALTYWMWAVEKGVVFEGQREGVKISLASSTKKHTPVYYLAVTVTDAAETVSKPVVKRLEAPFTSFFTADGFFVAKPFQQWLAGSVKSIGNVDVKNAVREAVVGAEGDVNGLGVAEADEGESSGVASGKASKRGKRKG